MKGPSEKTRPTIYDVARLAGVASMTVSRVLTGSANVTPETAEKVREAVRKLKYQMNENARALRMQRSRSIGLIVPSLLDPATATYVQVITEIASRHSFSVVLATSGADRQRELEMMQVFISRTVDGIVVLPVERGDAKRKRQLIESIPVVTLGIPMGSGVFDSVLTQDMQGGCLATEHLLEHHLKRVVFVGDGEGGYHYAQRLEGYRSVMAEAKMRPEILTYRSGEKALVDLLAALPQKASEAKLGLFTDSPSSTMKALQILQGRGLAPGRDVALIGYGDFLFSDVIPPGITVIREPTESLARLTIEMLIEQIESGATKHEGAAVSLPVELLKRGSCGCKPKI